MRERERERERERGKVQPCLTKDTLSGSNIFIPIIFDHQNIAAVYSCVFVCVFMCVFVCVCVCGAYMYLKNK